MEAVCAVETGISVGVDMGGLSLATPMLCLQVSLYRLMSRNLS